MFGKRKLPEKIPYHPNIKELIFDHSELYNLPDWSDFLPNVEKVTVDYGKLNIPEQKSIFLRGWSSGFTCIIYKGPLYSLYAGRLSAYVISNKERN
jgi:hypothetical protein